MPVLPEPLLDTTLTLRMSTQERERLDNEAEKLGISTAAYVRMCNADEEVQRKIAVICQRNHQRAENAQILRLLGQSRIANNLNQIAHAIHTGTFVFTPDVVAQINEAYEAILYIRNLLIEDMGVKVQ